MPPAVTWWVPSSFRGVSPKLYAPISMVPSKFIRSGIRTGPRNYAVLQIIFESEDIGKQRYPSSTLSTFPAGSLNQAISGPPLRKTPLASVSRGVPA